MTLEERLRATLARQAQRVRVSGDAWAAIAGRIGHPDRSRSRPLYALGAVAAAMVVMAAVVLLSGGNEATVVTSDPPTTTATSAVTTTSPTTTAPPGPRCSASALSSVMPDQPELPAAVAELRREMAAAGVACDYERLASLATAGADYFTYSYGAGADPARFWREAEQRGDRPLWYLVKLLALPFALQSGPSFADAEETYVWPAAAGGTEGDWSALSEAGIYTDEELDAMHLGGTGYLGYRLGITAGGDWIFFVAGD